MITFDIPIPQVLTLISAVIFPVLVGFVTKRTTDAGLKATILAGIAFGSQILTELAQALQSGTPYDLGQALILGLGAFIVGVATHYGFWKPTGVTEFAADHGVTDGADRVPGPDHRADRR